MTLLPEASFDRSVDLRGEGTGSGFGVCRLGGKAGDGGRAAWRDGRSRGGDGRFREGDGCFWGGDGRFSGGNSRFWGGGGRSRGGDGTAKNELDCLCAGGDCAGLVGERCDGRGVDLGVAASSGAVRSLLRGDTSGGEAAASARFLAGLGVGLRLVCLRVSAPLVGLVGSAFSVFIPRAKSFQNVHSPDDPDDEEFRTAHFVSGFVSPSPDDDPDDDARPAHRESGCNSTMGSDKELDTFISTWAVQDPLPTPLRGGTIKFGSYVRTLSTISSLPTRQPRAPEKRREKRTVQ